MKPIFIICLLFASSLLSVAQGRFCKSYEDYQADSWVELPSLETTHRGFGLTTGDKAMDKQLKREALVIQRSDTMYVNLRLVWCEKMRFGNGLADAYPLVGKKILFVTRRVDRKSSHRLMVSYMAFGLVGELITTSKVKKRACYILDSPRNGKYTDVMLLGDDEMRKLLADDKVLLDRYFMVKDRMERETASNILPLLREKGLVE